MSCCTVQDVVQMDTTASINILIDNQSAIKIATALSYSYYARMKHLDVHLHHVCDQGLNNMIQLTYCPMEHMQADLQTKPLTPCIQETQDALRAH